MPTPSGVNHLLLLVAFLKFCRFSETRFSGRFNVYLSFCLCYVTIGGFALGFYIITHIVKDLVDDF